MIGDPIMIDMHMLRVGTYRGTEVIHGKRHVNYIPLNSLGLMKPAVIRDIVPDPNVIQTVDRPGPALPGTFPTYKILLSAEHGQSWFLNTWLGNILPQILRQMREMREEVAVTQSALADRERHVSRGETDMLRDLQKRLKMIDSGKKLEDDSRKRRYLGGRSYG